MTRLKLVVGAAALVLVAFAPVAASAQDCKETLKVPGEPSRSRSLGAFPSSLFAWKKEAKAKFGDAYDNWAKSADKRIDCRQETTGQKLWVCIRSARPCTATASTSPSGPGPGPGPGSSGRPPDFADLNRLEQGMKGPEVELLQRHLNWHGANLKVDGSYGSGTAQAVRDYQRKEGLEPADGIAGRATKSRLMERALS